MVVLIFLVEGGKSAAVMAFLVKVMLAEGRILQWGSLSTAKKGSVTDALWDFLCFPQNQGGLVQAVASANVN